MIELGVIFLLSLYVVFTLKDRDNCKKIDALGNRITELFGKLNLEPIVFDHLNFVRTRSDELNRLEKQTALIEKQFKIITLEFHSKAISVSGRIRKLEKRIYKIEEKVATNQAKKSA